MKKNLFISLCVLFVIFAILLSPQKYIQVTSNAIEVWAKVLLPALLPFFIFTKLLISVGCVQDASQVFAKPMYKLYKTPPISSFVFFISILCGYPVGSKIASDLYSYGQIGKLDTQKIVTFTSNSGPMFIIGSVGIGMLHSPTLGYILYISHIIGAMLNGVVYRNKKGDNTKLSQKQKISETQTLSTCVNNSISSVMLVGGMIVFAFIIIEILSSLNVFYPLLNFLEKLGIDKTITNTIIFGFFEITKGCISASALNISTIVQTCIISAIISFGGLSTVLQSMAFLQNIVTYKFFILQKITHAILSLLVCVILCLIFV